MQEENNPFEKLTTDVKEYVNTCYNLVSLKATQKVAVVGSNTMAFVIIAMVASLFLFFINVALALFISHLLNNQYSGFFIVAGFYFFLTILFLLFGKRILINPIRNRIVRQILNDE